MRRTIYLILLSICAVILPVTKVFSQGMRFEGDTRDVYFSALEALTLECGNNCGPEAPCWANVSATNTLVSLYTKYEGPGPCAYCSCCMEAAAYATGVIRVVLYVDLESGRPLSKYNGGKAVYGNDIPKLSTLELRERIRVAACFGTSCRSCRAHSVMTFGDFTTVESQRRPICGDVSGQTNWTYLSADAAEFATFIYAFAENCTNVYSHIDINNATVWVPANSLVPSRPNNARSSVGIENQKISIFNATGENWTDLRLKLYGRDGAIVDSLFLSELGALKKLEWIVGGAPSNASVRFTARIDSATVHPMRSADQAAYFFTSPISPHILLQNSDSTGTRVDLVLHSGTTYERCRPGQLTVDLNTLEPAGWRIENANLSMTNSDEFDTDSLSSFWAEEIPSAPNSYVSLTERPGYLRMVASQAGQGADYYEETNFYAPRIFQNVAGDWILETKVEFNPTDDFEGAGIFLDGNRVAERNSNGREQRVYCLGSYVPYSGTTTYFRIIKQADSLKGYWSGDGETWYFNGAIKAKPFSAGLHVIRKNYGRGGDHDAIADFDFFRLTPLPPTSVDHKDNSAPRGYSLSQNYPNPFNPITQIRFSLPTPSHVSIVIFNAAGQQILTLINEEKPAGFHHVEFKAGSLASGIYMYKMQAGEFTASRKLLLTK